MKTYLTLQLVAFFLVGSMIVEHRVSEARAQAVAQMLLKLPMSALGEVKI